MKYIKLVISIALLIAIIVNISVGIKPWLSHVALFLSVLQFIFTILTIKVEVTVEKDESES